MKEKKESEMEKCGVRGLVRRYRDILVFMFFGGTATIIETFLYWLFYTAMGLPNVPSAFISWILVIVYTFTTNKRFVYVKPGWGIRQLSVEAAEFLGCRSMTGVLNLLLMYVSVDILGLPGVPMKVVTAILLGIINYLVGKLMIFRRK